MEISPQRHNQGTHAPWLLIVDDEKAFADTLRFRLETRDCYCLAAYSGEEALALLDGRDIEVVLLDLNMPGLHGLDALRLMKAKRPEVSVVLLTGEADFSTATRGMRRGACGYLLKPVDFDALLEALAKARQQAHEHKERLRAAETGRLITLGALAAGVGHEINNPLHIIMQRAEWLQELIKDAQSGSPDYDSMEKTAEIIHQQALRAGAITAQLLDLAHKARNNKARTSVGESLTKVCDFFAERAALLRTRLIVTVAENMPTLACSPTEFEPVLVHLLRNALDSVEAMRAPTKQQKKLQQTPESATTAEEGLKHASGDFPDMAEVRMEASQEGGMTRIIVRDTGQGVAPEDVPHIYEPFFSTRAVGQGTGLGLTVCHSIIAALRGVVHFSPASPHGAVFTVEIPWIREDN